MRPQAQPVLGRKTFAVVPGGVSFAEHVRSHRPPVLHLDGPLLYGETSDVCANLC